VVTLAQDEGAKRRLPWLRLALLAVLLLALPAFYALGLSSYFSWDYLRIHLEVLKTQAREHLLSTLAIFFLLYVLATALSFPVAGLLTLLSGALFGRWLGTAVVSLAATLGATLAFLSSRYLLEDVVRRRLGDRLQALHRGVEREGVYYLFMLRLVPLIPFWLINLGMGLTGMRVWRFSWVSMLGMLPATFLYANAGRALATLTSPSDILSPTVLVSLALLGLCPLAIRKLLGPRSKNLVS
jgi:uncharacterized membrane protein YdjX (TVP38/TMEM64 family)